MSRQQFRVWVLFFFHSNALGLTFSPSTSPSLLLVVFDFRGFRCRRHRRRCCRVNYNKWRLKLANHFPSNNNNNNNHNKFRPFADWPKIHIKKCVPRISVAILRFVCSVQRFDAVRCELRVCPVRCPYLSIPVKNVIHFKKSLHKI